MKNIQTDADCFNKQKKEDAWRLLAGLPEKGEVKIHPSIDSLRESEWSIKFEELMRDRLIMGSFRYGLLGDTNKPEYDRLESILNRISAYTKTGDLQLMADIANLCLCEFVEGKHPLSHVGVGDSNDHVSKKEINNG